MSLRINFPESKQKALMAAVHHYGFRSLSAFVQACGDMLIEHHQRGEQILQPYRLGAVPGIPEKKK